MGTTTGWMRIEQIYEKQEEGGPGGVLMGPEICRDMPRRISRYSQCAEVQMFTEVRTWYSTRVCRTSPLPPGDIVIQMRRQALGYQTKRAQGDV